MYFARINDSGWVCTHAIIMKKGPEINEKNSFEKLLDIREKEKKKKNKLSRVN